MHAWLPPAHFLAIGPIIFGFVLCVRIIVVGPGHEPSVPTHTTVLLQRQLDMKQVSNVEDYGEAQIGENNSIVMPEVSDLGEFEETEDDENEDLPDSQLARGDDFDGKPLRWRGLPYGDALNEDGEVYGGDHTVERFAAQGFEGPVVDNSWNVLFTHAPVSQWLTKHPDLLAGQPNQSTRGSRLTNHCEYYKAAGDKCAFANHLSKVASLQGNHRHLRTFELHEKSQHNRWIKSAKNAPNQYWVVKDCTNGASRGIKLLSGRAVRHSAPPPGTWAVAQEFLSNPYLGWGGHKFHMRLYVLATRWDPAGVLLFKDGLVFQSRSKYHGHKPSLRKDIFSSVSEKVRPLQLNQLWRHIDSAAPVSSKVVWDRVVSLLKGVFGIGLKESFGDPQHLSKRPFSCFDLFGVDVILDQQLEPYVMEVNIGPNLWLDREYEAMQRKVKGSLLDQVAKWARLHVESQSGPTAELTMEKKIALENASLQNFQRLL
jgi:hypothetical protein